MISSNVVVYISGCVVLMLGFWKLMLQIWKLRCMIFWLRCMYGQLLLIGSDGVSFIMLISISGVILLVVWVMVRIRLVIIVGLVIGRMIFYSVFVLVVLSVREFLWIVCGICVRFFLVVMIIIGMVRIVRVSEVQNSLGVLKVGVGRVLGKNSWLMELFSMQMKKFRLNMLQMIVGMLVRLFMVMWIIWVSGFCLVYLCRQIVVIMLNGVMISVIIRVIIMVLKIVGKILFLVLVLCGLLLRNFQSFLKYIVILVFRFMVLGWQVCISLLRVILFLWLLVLCIIMLLWLNFWCRLLSCFFRILQCVCNLLCLVVRLVWVVVFSLLFNCNLCFFRCRCLRLWLILLMLFFFSLQSLVQRLFICCMCFCSLFIVVLFLVIIWLFFLMFSRQLQKLFYLWCLRIISVLGCLMFCSYLLMIQEKLLL